MSSINPRRQEIVCLVDDDASVLKSIGRLMASDGLSVRPFSHPEEFLDYVITNETVLVVLDIWMAEMSGLDVQARLSEVSPLTHVIVMTGRDDAAAKAAALRLGAVAFFKKPFDDHEFLAAVRDVLGLPRSG